MVLTKKFGLRVDSGKIVKSYALTNLNGLKPVPRVHVTDKDYADSGNEIGKDSCGFSISSLFLGGGRKRGNFENEANSLKPTGIPRPNADSRVTISDLSIVL